MIYQDIQKIISFVEIFAKVNPSRFYLHYGLLESYTFLGRFKTKEVNLGKYFPKDILPQGSVHLKISMQCHTIDFFAVPPIHTYIYIYIYI